MKSLLLLAALSTLLSLTGCSWLKPYQSPITQGNVMPISVLNELQPGLTRDQVEALLGPEMGKDLFDPKHSEYIFYTTHPDFDKKVAHHIIVDYDQEGYLVKWREGEPVTLKNRHFLFW
ncbi:outer membrane protein assembly factor BamE [Galenea microaerophila]